MDLIEETTTAPGRNRKMHLSDLRREAMRHSRESVPYWDKKSLEAKINFERDCDANYVSNVENYIKKNHYYRTKSFFYYTLERLAYKNFIRITKRHPSNNHPLEFVILDKNECIGMFDCMFVKKEGESATSATVRDPFLVMKSTADNKWKNQLGWFLTRRELVDVIDSKLEPGTSKFSSSNILQIQKFITSPYPYCFTDIAATERVFKFITIPSDTTVNISNTIDAALYKAQLKFMHAYSLEIFKQGPPFVRDLHYSLVSDKDSGDKNRKLMERARETLWQ